MLTGVEFEIVNIGTFLACADQSDYNLDTPEGCKASVRVRLARRDANGGWTTVKVGDVDVDDRSSYFSVESTPVPGKGQPVFTVPVDAVFADASLGGGAELAIVVDIIVEDN